MPSTARVSVVIPFYETPARFLLEAIQSVLRQTYREWELILVDDGSKEQVTEIAERWAADNEHVRYLEHRGHENRGHSASRNLGIAHAVGHYVALLDADDVWLPHKLEQQVALMDSHPQAGMLYGNTIYWHSWNQDAPTQNQDYSPCLGFDALTMIPPPGSLPLFIEGRAAVPCTCSILARRDVVLEVSGFVESVRGLYEDQVFYAKMCLRAPVLVAPECWDLYRQHQASLCRRASRRELNESRAQFLDWLEAYLIELGVENAAVWKALRREQRRSRHPLLARAVRLGRRLARRAAGSVRPGEVSH